MFSAKKSKGENKVYSAKISKAEDGFRVECPKCGSFVTVSKTTEDNVQNLVTRCHVCRARIFQA
jgi:transcription elongation factor Elf1